MVSSDNDSEAGERLPSGEWFQLRNQVIERDSASCRNCLTNSNLVVHHIVPLEVGGTNRLSNLVTLCRECHTRIHGTRRETSAPDRRVSSDRYVPTLPELRSIISQASHPFDRIVITMLAKTGIGIGELCNLNLADVDLKDDEVRTSFETSRSGWNETGGPAIRIRYGGDTPYNNRSERIRTTAVPVDEELEVILKQWLSIRPDSIAAEQPLLVNTQEDWGHRATPTNVRYRLQKLGASLDNQVSESGSLTPMTVRSIFIERFDGQPAVREAILGSTEPTRSPAELAESYRNHIYRLFLSDERQ